MTASIRAGILGDFVKELQLLREYVGLTMETAFLRVLLKQFFCRTIMGYFGMKRLKYVVL